MYIASNCVSAPRYLVTHRFAVAFCDAQKRGVRPDHVQMVTMAATSAMPVASDSHFSCIKSNLFIVFIALGFAWQHCAQRVDVLLRQRRMYLQTNICVGTDSCCSIWLRTAAASCIHCRHCWVWSSCEGCSSWRLRKPLSQCIKFSVGSSVPVVDI